LEVAAKQIEAQSTWTAPNGTVFKEVALEQVEGSEVMQQDFDQAFLPGRLGLQVNG